MKKPGIKYLLLANSLLFIMNVMGQEWTAGDNVTLHISSFALIETNHAPITLSLTTSTAGAAAATTSNSDLFVKISSIVPGNTNREITANISGGTIPTGTKLTLVSAACTTTNSGGDLGTPVATPITLSSVDQNLVTGVSTCYTGTGYNDGYQMTFTWEVDDPATNYGQIESNTIVITVIFTITAHDGN